MSIFGRKVKCPYCYEVLQVKPDRKLPCPHCNKPIYIRMGELVTEEEAQIEDWIARIGISRSQFDKARGQLSKQFGQQASVNDTVWKVLNELIVTWANQPSSLEQVYRHMSALASKEGKDPTMYLLEAERTRSQYRGKGLASKKDIFLSHDELDYVRKLRQNGEFDKAQELLLRAEPSPAVLDELRKLASAKAAMLKKQGDWAGVIKSLEGYEAYATKWRNYCIKTVNAEPPLHTERDKALLVEAKRKI